jgi:hypothetical protein
MVEGSAVPLKPHLLRFFPDQMEKTMKILDGLAQRGIVQGSELFLAEHTEARAYGIEELKIYTQNIRAFRKVSHQQAEGERFLQDLERSLRKDISLGANKKLRRFLKEWENFEEGRLPLQDWLSILRREATKMLGVDLKQPLYQFDWPMLVRYFTLDAIEKKGERRKNDG